jgi:ABC-2 type transport system ATP-binding protein
MNIIEVQNLTKHFGKGPGRAPVKALEKVSFRLESGKVLGVIGPNGSGKTTLFKCLMNFVAPSGGSIRLFENRFPRRELGSKIGFLPERAAFYPELTAPEILRFFGKLYRIPSAILEKRIRELLDFVDLEKHRDLRVQGYSKGMLQRLGIALCLVNDSELLILDEPLSGLDCFGVCRIHEILRKLIEEGRTVVFTSHVLSHIQDLCTDLLILFRGKGLWQGPIEELVREKGRCRIDLAALPPFDFRKARRLLEEGGYRVERVSEDCLDLEDRFIRMIEEAP